MLEDSFQFMPQDVIAVGHRVVHGGSKFSNSIVITPQVLVDIEALSALAPTTAVNLEAIRAAMAQFPGVPHVAVFDTAFHQSLPPYAYLYGLPYDYYKKEGIRRYGFHGTSHRYVSLKSAEVVKRPLGELGDRLLPPVRGLVAVRHRPWPLGRHVHGHDADRGLIMSTGQAMSTRR